jgi:hypothetical protein
MKTAKMTPKQKNDHYRRLNERFDSRCDELVKLGFTQEAFTNREFGISISIFTRKCWWVSGGVQTITAQTIMHADELAWADEMESITRS